jgi:phage tail sheath gpL-like
MTISFNAIPGNIRRPFVYIEFDNTRAIQGGVEKQFHNLVLGQRLSSGSVAAAVPTKVTSDSEAALAFGFGSMLHKMAQVYFQNNTSQDTTFVALDDNGSGAAASGTFAFSGTATENGTVYAYIGGDRYTSAVVSGDTASNVAAALIAAIQAASDEAVTVTQSSGTVNVIFKHKGAAGNELDLRLNYFPENEVLPAGLSCTVGVMAGGTTNPDITATIAALGDGQYDVIVMPYTDSANLVILETELANRWGPLTQNDGFAITAKNTTYGALASYGLARNSSHVATVMATKVPTAPWALAAGFAGVIALQMETDPGRPVTALPIAGVRAPGATERLTNSERNLLLFDGISTLSVDAGGNVCIERFITMYRQNAQGAPDKSYLNANTVFLLSRLRYDFRNSFLLKFPRHKLGDDGNRFGSGQAVMTPKLGKAFAIGKFNEWVEKAWVENIDQFKNDLIVERNTTDKDRLDFLLPPDLINQLLVTAVQIQFLL